MKQFLLLFLAVLASEKKENCAENDPKNEQKIENNKDTSIFVKIEEDEYAKVSKTSKFIGVSYHKNSSKWQAQRWNKTEKISVPNGYYDDEETAAHASDTLARKLMDNCEQKLKLNFPDDYTEIHPEKKRATSKFIGVGYHKPCSKWQVTRWHTMEKKLVYNGFYDDEETAAHASDTLARELMDNGEQKLKLNFPDDHTEIYPDKTTSKYIGVSYKKNRSKWRVERYSKNATKDIFNGSYDDEETAAHASDTLARKIMENRDQKLKLNFPDDHTEVHPEEKQKSSKYIGVKYNKNNSNWSARRWSKHEKKYVSNGCNYTDEETAASASDTLARTFTDNGEQGHKLNFPDDNSEQNHKEKRKRSADLELEQPQNN